MIEIGRIVDSNECFAPNAKPLDAYIYTNLFDEKFFSQLQKNVKSIVKNTIKDTYLTHNTTFVYGGKKTKLVSHKQNDREQNVIFDLSLTEDYYYQTVDTIKEWSNLFHEQNVGPIFLKVLKTFENLEPFSNEKDSWIFYRLHINYLAPQKYLSLHRDGNPILFHNDLLDARMRSTTIYLYDHQEGEGGEFWALNGFVYKPKANSAININGNQFIHGVTENVSTIPRLAFTIRAAHKDDLYLPGHPSKHLYDVYNL